MGVPYTFATATTSIPLSELDANFNTPVTIGTSTVGLGNTTTSLVGLSNVSTTTVGSTGSLAIQSSSTTAITINSSQQVGVGTTPSAWGTGYTGLQVGAGAAVVGSTSYSAAFVGANWYFNGTNDTYIGTDYATRYYQVVGTHRWYIAPSGTAGNAITFTEAMRIDSIGNLLVNTTSAFNSGKICVDGGSSYVPITCRVTPTTGFTQIYFSNGNGIVGSIYTSGSATTYATSSDYRLKENIAPMTGALDKVSQLKPCTYDWIADKSKGQGFIAHELQAVVPECVIGEKDAVDAEGNPIYQGIDTSFLVATLTAAIQELNATLTTQATTIASLQSEVLALKNLTSTATPSAPAV